MFSKIKKLRKDYLELKYLAYHDALTGLLNRNWLYKNKDSISSKYIYFLDVNNLHIINKDGHTFGDKYLIKAVKSIKLNNNDIFIRYAGDEFIIFSNHKNLVTSNSFFTVGFAEIKNDISKAINNADKDMIKKKNGQR